MSPAEVVVSAGADVAQGDDGVSVCSCSTLVDRFNDRFLFGFVEV